MIKMLLPLSLGRGARGEVSEALTEKKFPCKTSE